MRTKDAFIKLGLTMDTATVADVDLAWRTRRSAAHPDKPGGTAAAFHELKSAYEMASRHAALPKICSVCGGTGKRSVAKGFSTMKLNCAACRGSGVRGE